MAALWKRRFGERKDHVAALSVAGAIRAYDAAGMMIDAEVIEGAEARPLIERA